MGNPKHVVAAILLAAASVATAQSPRNAARAGNPPAGDWMTQSAQTFTVVLQVERDPNRQDRGMNAQAVAAVCKSTAIVDPAVAAVLKLPAAETRGLVTVDAQATNESILTLSVTLQVPPGRLPEDAGPKLLDELTKRATGAFAKAAELQVAPLKARRAELERRADEAAKQLADLDAELARVGPTMEAASNAYGRGGLSRVEVERQRSTVSIQLAGARARLASAQQAAKAATSQPVVAAPTSRPAELAAELLALRQSQLDGTAPDAQAARAAATADLIEARLLVALADGLNAFRPFEGRMAMSPEATLASLRQQIAEYEAQMASYEAQLAALPSAATQPAMSVNDYQQLQSDRAEARNRLRQVKSELEQFDRQSGTLRAPVIVPLTGKE